MIAVVLALAAVVPPAPTPKSPAAAVERPALGLAVNLPPGASPVQRQEALDDVRRAGVSLFALEVSWPSAEPRARRYELAEVTRTARLLRQSGALIHLDLPLVNGPSRLLPADLVPLAFDDPKLAARLGALLDALSPALADVATLSLGNQTDAYFASRPDELRGFLRLVKGAVEFLSKSAPRLLVGVSTAVPMDSPFPAAVPALHASGGASFYLYAPFAKGELFAHRPPATLDGDWKAIVAGAGGKPVAFTEVSYSSAPVNGSSPERQGDFVRRMRRFLEKTDRKRVLFARYVAWRDEAPARASAPRRGQPPHPRPPLPEGEGATAGGRGASIGTTAPTPPALTPFRERRAAFLANRGLTTADGRPKPAWREFAARPAAATVESSKAN